MSAEVLLVRHASHADAGRVLTGRLPGRGLTERGRAEAARVAERLAARPVGRVLASPRARAAETAAAIAAPHGLAVETVDALDEIDFGDWSGRSFDALEADATWRAWNGARGLARTPAGDTMGAVQHRTRALLDGLARAGGCAVIVSHADVLRAMICDRLGLAVDLWARIAIEPGCVATLELADASAALRGLDNGEAAGWR